MNILFERFDPQKVQPDKDIGMGEWELGENQLFTSGVASCIVLAGHNRQSGWGLLGHFSALDSQTDHSDLTVFQAAVAALEELGNPEATSLWLGGGKPFYEGKSDTVATDRSLAEHHIRQDYLRKHSLDPALLQVIWSPTNTYIDVTLDCKQGELTVAAENSSVASQLK